MTVNRRMFLGGTVSGFFAYAMSRRLDAAFSLPPSGSAKRCLVLWMNGGPSQIDTFDPKPGTSNGGPLQSITTAVPGISICETMPQIAKQMNQLSVIRNLTSPEGDHVRAQYYLHTGFRFVPGFPRPAMGARICV